MSAPAVNQIVLLGRLTKDPESRNLPQSGSVCELRVAVNDRSDRDRLFIDVAAFGKQAEAFRGILKKGRDVAVTGRLVLDQWEAPGGAQRSRYQVIGSVTFGNDRSENGARPDGRDE